jgi:hypothetical protein
MNKNTKPFIYISVFDQENLEIQIANQLSRATSIALRHLNDLMPPVLLGAPKSCEKCATVSKRMQTKPGCGGVRNSAHYPGQLHPNPHLPPAKMKIWHDSAKNKRWRHPSAYLRRQLVDGFHTK